MPENQTLSWLKSAGVDACVKVLQVALILAVGRRKRDEVAHVFSEMEQVWSKYSIFGKAEDE